MASIFANISDISALSVNLNTLDVVVVEARNNFLSALGGRTLLGLGSGSPVLSTLSTGPGSGLAPSFTGFDNPLLATLATGTLDAALAKTLGDTATSLGKNTTLSLTAEILSNPPKDAFWYGFSSAAGPVDVTVEVLGGLAQPTSMPDNFAGTVYAIETMANLEPLLVDLEKATGLALMPTSAGESAHADGIAVQVTANDQIGTMQHRYVAVLPVAAGLLLEKNTVTEKQRPLLKGLADMQVSCALYLTGPTLLRSELFAFRAGDVLVLPESRYLWQAEMHMPAPYGGWSGVVVRNDEQMVFRVVGEVLMSQIENETVLHEGLSNQHLDMHQSVALEHTASTETDGYLANENVAAPAHMLWNSLPVRLSVVLDVIEYPLDKLLHLQTGSVLSLPFGGESLPVRLLAGASSIARGELVSVGDGYGILINTVSLPQAD